ncbi:zinc ribbon domain-containing protein [Sphingopyxis sp. QXT-31]|uniref:zinc ribbon domain-containing protein n=1 Tax=Sphingopyxis sp. QXT-31 TaxID=1357916 RepID=UPI00214FB82E|nr:zinc ribbon domain-containing protein [Sphingopyxis sp. QXT-31]
MTICGCGGDGCGGGMTTSTGKSGQYKYYACSNRARAGPSICNGRRMPMHKLDEIVLNALEERLLTPERLHDLLSSWLDHALHATESRREKLRQLRTRKTSLGAGLERLLDLVAEGHLTASDPRFARKHADQKAQLSQVEADIVLLERQLANSEKRITPELIDRFAKLMRERLRESDPALRQYYVRSIVGRVEVGDAEIRIMGTTKALEHAIGRVGAKPHFPVPNIEREWCTRRDSNPWPLPSEGVLACLRQPTPEQVFLA